MRPVLLHHDGDRWAFKKQLQAGSLLEVVQALPVDRIRERPLIQLIDTYWLNGCAEEAIALLSRVSSPTPGVVYYPLVTEDIRLIDALADRPEYEGHRRNCVALPD